VPFFQLCVPEVVTALTKKGQPFFIHVPDDEKNRGQADTKHLTICCIQLFSFFCFCFCFDGRLLIFFVCRVRDD
jgi:hypothetical protein